MPLWSEEDLMGSVIWVQKILNGILRQLVSLNISLSIFIRDICVSVELYSERSGKKKKNQVPGRQRHRRTEAQSIGSKYKP